MNKKSDLSGESVKSLLIKGLLTVTIPSVVIFTANFFFYRFPHVEAAAYKAQREGKLTRRVICKLAQMAFPNPNNEDREEVREACLDEN